uniref:Uncharacterized protein n=1 Tax=Rhizophora mucronata TaxID=61149 RepID=A0A2P2NC51_RHIMU
MPGHRRRGGVRTKQPRARQV